MTAAKLSSPFPVFTDASGAPLDDGYIYVGEYLLNPISNPIALYWDETLTTPAAQPIRTSGGYPVRYGTPSKIYASEGSYSIIVKDKKQSIVFSSLSENSIGGSGGAALIGYRDTNVENAIDQVLPFELSSISQIPLAGFEEGAKCKIGDTTFLIINGKPRSSRYPVISAGNGLYAIPVDGHLRKKLGTLSAVGSLVTGPQYNTPYGPQSMEFDAVAGTAIFTTTHYGITPEKSYFSEYAYSSSGIGSLLFNTAELTMSHGDYFAIEYEKGTGNRYVWYAVPTTSDTFGPCVVVRNAFSASMTDASAVTKLNFSSDSGRVEVSWFDSDHLLITRVGATSFIVHIDDAINSDLSKAKIVPFQVTEGALYLRTPGQQRKAIDNFYFGVCGNNSKVANTCFATVADSYGEIMSRMVINTSSAGAADEPEGICWWWDSSILQFRNIISIWVSSTSFQLYDIANTGVSANYNNAIATGQLSQGIFQSAESPVGNFNGAYNSLASFTPFYATTVMAGTPFLNETVDPAKFRFEQWSNNATRQGGRIRYNNGEVEHLFDGSADTVYAVGFRLNINGNTLFQVGDDGVYVGQAYTIAQKATYNASLQVTAPSGKFGVYSESSTSLRPGYMSSSALDYAVVAGQSMQFGEYTAATDSGTLWANMNISEFRPSTTNGTMNLGSASNKFNTLFASNGTINTSDANLKTAVSKLSENEIEAAKQLSDEIGYFQFLSAISEKGENARHHIGMTVQRAIEILSQNGLDPMRYAFICYDEWEDEYIDFPAEYESIDSGEKDEYGNPIFENVLVKESNRFLKNAAGSQYGFRMDELLAFISAGFNARLKALESK